jgi:cytochrome b
MIRVWDPFVRVFHWGLVAAFVLAWFTADENEALHEWAGYAVLALIAVRVVWGFVGTRYARFGQFVRGPRAVTAYLRDIMRGQEPRYIGHNPAGAAMILAILLTISGTAFTGWLMAEPSREAMLPAPPQAVAPAFADEGEGDGDAGEDVLEDLHETLANLMLLLITLHVGGSCSPHSGIERTSSAP